MRRRLDGDAAPGRRPRPALAALAAGLRCGGIPEVQCGGRGNLDRVRAAIDTVAAASFTELQGWSPWVFAGLQETQARLRAAGFTSVRCWLQERPGSPTASARRSSRLTWRACPSNAASRSPPRP